MMLSSVDSNVCYDAIFSRQQCVLCCYLQQTAMCVMMLSSVDSKVCYAAILSKQQCVLCCYLQQIAECIMLPSSVNGNVRYAALFSRQLSALCCYRLIDNNVCCAAIFSIDSNVYVCQCCCYLQQIAACVMLPHFANLSDKPQSQYRLQVAEDEPVYMQALYVPLFEPTTRLEVEAIYSFRPTDKFDWLCGSCHDFYRMPKQLAVINHAA